MINGTINEFMDKLYYGEEMLLKYQNKEYFLQGWTSNNMATMVVDKRTLEPFVDYYWKCTRATMRECAEEFLAAKIWDEKVFVEIESTVIWLE